MKTIALLLAATLTTATAAATATDNYQHNCNASEDAGCPTPPAPPAPPVPPVLPMPPAPPAPPPIPAVPAAAHAACAGKSAGTTLTHVIAKGETMTGTCEKRKETMRFILHSYTLNK
ncbi:hypothetical protein [Massilia eurypsychrophila]|jgi:hypothetical protein|uniref:hypothetical protein n=1 Tax=Massilia eurypsychrophila TaxID=1485217 RepID=UPI0015D4B452|nr:hypothetical protein [Massilia eurypsychrophila]